MRLRSLYAAAAVLALAVGVGLLTPSGTAHAQPPIPHYECYDVLPMGPLQELPQSVVLETQFGVEEVGLGPMPIHLCAPALKQIPTGGWEGSLLEPHVECLPIAGASPGKIVNLVTQFGVQENVVVGPAMEMCMPVSKTVYIPEQEPPTGLEAVPHYECYAISGEPPVFPPVLVETQFGIHEVVVGEPTRLCLPAIKNQEPGSLDEPHVECFRIDAAPPVPEVWVNLENQFGTQYELVVGPALELCVPALKELAETSIGGIAEAPDADASALEATASDGSSGTTYAAIAVAAAAVLLGAGGWYARRRWLS